MRFKGLKLVKYGLAVFAASCIMVACNNEAENNSTAASGNENKKPDSGTQDMNKPAKKTGKASVAMAKADAGEKMQKDKMGYYNYTEVLPAFNGGQDALENYITNNIEYPQDAIDNSVEGTVNIQFAVDEKGAVSNVTAIGNKIGYGLEEEAIKVVAAMPKWTPGQVKGKNVKTWRVLPITYKLES